MGFLETLGNWTSALGPIADIAMWNIGRKDSKSAAQHGLSWRVADAKAAGIHPLAALGMSPINMPATPVGDTFTRMGQDLRYAKSPERRLDLENKKAQIASENARTSLFEAQRKAIENEINSSNRTNLPPLNQSSPFGGLVSQDSPKLNYDLGIDYTRVNVPISEKPGIKAGQGPFEEYSTLSDGSVLKHPEQQKSEALEGDWVTQYAYASYKAMSYLGQIEAYLWSKDPKAEKARNILRSERPTVRPEHRGKYEFRYHPFKGRWFLTKIRNHSYLYAIGHGEPYGIESLRR